MNTIAYSFLILALLMGVRCARNRELFGKRAIPFDQLFPLGRKRAGRELLGKRSDPSAAAVSSEWFGRESRRGRELFGKRSAAGLMDLYPVDYNDADLNTRILAEPSIEYRFNPEQDVSIEMGDMRSKRRSRELLGKRSSYELSDDQFESLLSAIRRDRRGRGHELLG
ncbi:hypothetical protein L596_005900 [Steinernema carpocapsae]|uniref:Uncharacterized protein n=1 Tax=Steinernema carpocapsae TaxID=34508 RepID=A0A4U8V1S1_STECR|nr:hypothetical protein L596_005900 [Steinernema carpocapsae]